MTERKTTRKTEAKSKTKSTKPLYTCPTCKTKTDYRCLTCNATVHLNTVGNITIWMRNGRVVEASRNQKGV